MLATQPMHYLHSRAKFSQYLTNAPPLDPDAFLKPVASEKQTIADKAPTASKTDDRHTVSKVSGVTGVPAYFNTYDLVARLREGGMPEAQAVACMQAVASAMQEHEKNSSQHLVAMTEFKEMSQELREQLFNASMKYDLQQKHLKDLYTGDLQALRSDFTSVSRTLSADFQAFRSDLKMTQKADLMLLQEKLTRLEKELDAEKGLAQSYAERLENRIIKYGLGTVATLCTLTLAAVRLAL